ncbi:hypothetical protein KA021_02505 [Candidatus Saccharibacteria bacterium]|jgi:hypothetical protein|nr:hypothetical protein [Candidatus Saccharibacteria bacterium]
MTDFTELHYSHTKIQSAVYIKNAVDILLDIQRTLPQSLPSLLAPSNILMFAGLRSLSPYNDFAELTPTQIDELGSQLSKIGIQLMNETYDTIEGEVVTYTIVNTAVLKKLSSRYNFLDEKFPIYSGKTYDEILLWTFLSERHLANRMYTSSDPLPIEWSKDYYGPSTLLLGMELGYPGSAISSVMYNQVDPATYKDTDMLEVMIADQEDTAHVTFNVQRTIRNTPEITTSERLWKNVIRGVQEACNAIK